MKEKLNANLSKTEVKLQICRKSLIMAIFVTIAFTAPLGLKSQQYYYYYYYYPQSNFSTFLDDYDYYKNAESFYNPFNRLKYFKRPDNQYKKAHIEKMQINYQDPKKDEKPYLGVEVNYDKNGNTTLFKKYNKKGKIINHTESVYNEKGIVLSYKNFKRNGKTSYWYENVLDEKSRIIEGKTFSKDGKPEITRVFVYNEKSRVIENLAYKGKDKKLINRIVNKYYDNGEIESTANYNGKGKLKKFWSYACSNKAEEVKNLKDTVRFCKLSDFDKDGNFTITNISTGEDGMIYKDVRKYNKDSILIESLSYNNKNILTTKTTNNKTATGWVCNVVDFNKNQQPRIEYVYEYNDDKILLKSSRNFYNRNGIVTYRYEYLYDKNGYFVKYNNYKKGGSIIDFSTEYERNEKGLPLIVYSKNDEGKVTFKTSYQYQ